MLVLWPISSLAISATIYSYTTFSTLQQITAFATSLARRSLLDRALHLPLEFRQNMLPLLLSNDITGVVLTDWRWQVSNRWGVLRQVAGNVVLKSGSTVVAKHTFEGGSLQELF